jgi:hypothetical protein
LPELPKSLTNNRSYFYCRRRIITPCCRQDKLMKPFPTSTYQVVASKSSYRYALCCCLYYFITTVYCFFSILPQRLSRHHQLEVSCDIHLILTICRFFFLQYVLSEELKFRWELQAVKFLVFSGCQAGFGLLFLSTSLILLQQVAFLCYLQGKFESNVPSSQFLVQLTHGDCSSYSYVWEVSY